MNVEVTVTDRATPVIDRLMKAMGDDGRADLHGVAANALKAAIQRHIHGYAMSKHATAHRFGAQPTRHYEAGANAISFSASVSEGVVTIPIPGISRAFGDVEITPSRANRLTIPLRYGGPEVYGRTVFEMRSLGWRFFQGKKGHEAEDILFGYRGKGKDREVRAMFVLKSGIIQRRDPSLLPTREEMAQTVTKAVLARIKSVLQKSGKAVA